MKQISERDVEVSITVGVDGAIVVFIDTPDFEPDGSDGGPGLRVWVNDATVYEGRAFPAEDAFLGGD